MTKYDRGQKHRVTPGIGIIFGLLLLLWAGLSLYYGTTYILDILIDVEKIDVTLSSNPVSFWILESIIILGGLFFIAFDILGIAYGHRKIGDAINNKVIYKKRLKRKKTQ